MDSRRERVEVFDRDTIVESIRNTILAAIPDGATFRCHPVGRSECYVGRDRSNDLIALFPACEAPRQLRVNEVEFLGRSKVEWVDSHVQSGTVAILKFQRNTPDDIQTFSSVVASILNATRDSSTGEEYGSVVDAWLSLLNSGRRPTFAEVLGIWGELFAIASSTNAGQLINSWQWRDDDPADFIFHGQGIEVKTTTSPTREHSTSLTQHRHNCSVRTLLVSIKTFEELTGASVEDLSNRILATLGVDTVNSAKLISAVARRIGFGSEYRITRFSESLAAQSIRVFDWRTLPNPKWPLEVIRAQWTFVLRDEDGSSISNIPDEFCEIARILS